MDIEKCNFEEGKNYTFKVRRTTYNFIYDTEIEMYDFQKKSPTKMENAYILFKDLALAYRLCTKGLKNLPEIKEL